MNPLTLFWDCVAVGAGLTVDLSLLAGLALLGLFLLSVIRDHRGDAETSEEAE